MTITRGDYGSWKAAKIGKFLAALERGEVHQMINDGATAEFIMNQYEVSRDTLHRRIPKREFTKPNRPAIYLPADRKLALCTPW